MKKLHKRILVLAFLLSLSLSILADPGGPGSPGDTPSGILKVGDAGSSGVPLDGGVLELLVAGAVFLGY